MLLLIHSAKQIVTVTNGKRLFLKGTEQRNLEVFEHPDGVAVIVNEYVKALKNSLKPLFFFII